MEKWRSIIILKIKSDVQIQIDPIKTDDAVRTLVSFKVGRKEGIFLKNYVFTRKKVKLWPPNLRNDKPMDEKIKTWTLCFPAKENPNMEKALFDWPIVLQYDVKAKYR